MKTQEEIEKFATAKYGTSIYSIDEVEAYKNGYTQCQEDMLDKKYTEEDMIAFAYQFSSINVADFRKHLRDFNSNLKEKNKQD